MADANASANTVLLALNPAVAALATLLEITSSARADEFSPLSPC